MIGCAGEEVWLCSCNLLLSTWALLTSSTWCFLLPILLNLFMCNFTTGRLLLSVSRSPGLSTTSLAFTLVRETSRAPWRHPEKITTSFLLR